MDAKVIAMIRDLSDEAVSKLAESHGNRTAREAVELRYIAGLIEARDIIEAWDDDRRE